MGRVGEVPHVLILGRIFCLLYSFAMLTYISEAAFKKVQVAVHIAPFIINQSLRVRERVPGVPGATEDDIQSDPNNWC